MMTKTVDDVELAVKIGDHSPSIAVVGKTKDETKLNLLKLFAGKNDKKKRNHRSEN